MSDVGSERPARERPAAARRFSKRKLKLIAWGAACVGFALPWAALEAMPNSSASTQQVVMVPAGSRVVVTKSAPGKAPVYVVSGKGGAATTTPTTTTGGTHPPP